MIQIQSRLDHTLKSKTEAKSPSILQNDSTKEILKTTPTLELQSSQVLLMGPSVSQGPDLAREATVIEDNESALPLVAPSGSQPHLLLLPNRLERQLSGSPREEVMARSPRDTQALPTPPPLLIEILPCPYSF
eukprot:Gb_02597 [translate_table: standard]